MISPVRRHRGRVRYSQDLPSPPGLLLLRHPEVIDRDHPEASAADAWEADEL